MKKIGEHRWVKALQEFLKSEWYLALIVVLMVCANLFGLELAVFYVYLLFGLLAVLFDTDLKAVLPIGCCCYMTISYENNPAMNHDTAGFYNSGFKIQLALICAIAAVILLGRLIMLLINGERKKLPALTFGFAALGLALMLGGIFTKFYDFRTALFGFVVIVSLCGLYFLFYYGVNWKEIEKGYFAKLFLAIGFGLLVELLGIYIKSGILTNPELKRNVLITGWGMYNNVGCVLSMCLPAALYLSLKEKHGWIFTISGIVLAAGLILTQSRGSILFGGAIYLAGLVIVLVKCGKRERIHHLIVLGSALAVALVFAIAYWQKLLELFSDVIEKTFSGDPSNARGPIYAQGWRHFQSNPFFGVGFYQCTAFRWGWSSTDNVFLPPRYHNTFIQLLATGGIFATGCYLLHRFETVILLFRHPTVEKTFIALCISGLLLTSLVECHFFSFGPALLYGVLLVCAEGQPKEPEPAAESVAEPAQE